MKLKYLLIFTAPLLAGDLSAQVPVTVNRSTITSGGTISLPSFSGTANLRVVNGPYTLISTLNSGSGSTNWASVGGVVSTTPSSGLTGGSGNGSVYIITITSSPTVTIVTNAPSTFFGTIYAYANYSSGQQLFAAQTYEVTIVNDGSGGGGGGSTVPTGTLIGQADTIESISRKTTDTSYRKLVGFSLSATTNAVFTTLAASLSNTSTNANPFISIGLYKDADGGGAFDPGDTLIATTTNASGFAVFTGLSEPITTTNTTYFIAGRFDPSQQSKNSFITAAVSSQSIVMMVTNSPIATLTATALGKQYAFLDTSQAEDDAATLALSNQISSAISAATSGFSRSSSSSASNSTDLIDTILPAAAAGAAGIGAAFTSDSITTAPISQEYTPKH